MNTKKQFTEVEFGQQKVKVPKGGYYDRFRMNPNLDEVAQDPAAGNIDFFRKIPKQMVESRVGPVWAPNFYYRTSNVQVLMLAPLKQLRKKLPAPLEPLQAFPGFGLVAVTFFTYAVCDNDPYNEASVAIVVRKPNAKGLNALELLNSIRQRHFYAHVLALPVDTEIARVRGVYGYQLPKWLTEINVDINPTNIYADLKDTSGQLDLSLSTQTPELKHVKSESRMNEATMLHQVDNKWHQTLVQSNTLAFAQKLLPRNVKLVRHGGPVSQLLDELGASKILRLDVVQDAQVVLNLPKAL
ncbi:acetoacetate decarboxylase family protein [Acinetobacter venetianus]|uniref:acetoacetate decarboxylase family protein n=1 Tax=Acinetobacter venetianus TaxID=52133 RepID=UPI0010A5D55C|nr:acetoacetate decarboxylase family protein [Acinetobacter venetianus]MCR4532085.1 acetoacetate decarboxylase family protein [Acinetobacter venetianus]MDA0695907.1 acetoacetate decarboxylase family protein [Pseudomonadota bacterium]MDA1254138.1 acetoacetate decarboxylase family protein [Pseudomonadota bacterium]